MLKQRIVSDSIAAKRSTIPNNKIPNIILPNKNAPSTNIPPTVSIHPEMPPLIPLQLRPHFRAIRQYQRPPNISLGGDAHHADGVEHKGQYQYRSSHLSVLRAKLPLFRVIPQFHTQYSATKKGAPHYEAHPNQH
ncbi:MAG: hypothetical protein J1E58_04180 [Prevotella sp.]|nr:hypothetical protein [Prevotella sp.]